MRVKLLTYGGAGLIALAGLMFALVLVQGAGATGQKVTLCHKPGTPAEKTLSVPQSAVQGHLGHGDYLGECRPENPPPPPPPPPPGPPPASPPPPPSVTCDHSVMAGKDGEEGNDDCATTTTPPPSPTVLNCPAGTSEMGRSGGQVLCLQTTREVITIEKPVIKTRTVVKWRTRVKVKRIVMWKTRTIHHFCPVPGNG